MSKLQINMNQSELLMRIRLVLNCTKNEDIIEYINDLRSRDFLNEALKTALFEEGYECARDELEELIEQDKAKKPKDLRKYRGYGEKEGDCPVCGYEVYEWWAGCPKCLQRIDWRD